MLPNNQKRYRRTLAKERCTSRSKEKYREIKEWIREKGIDIEHEQDWGGEYQSFYFRDPDGHSLEIVPAGMWD